MGSPTCARPALDVRRGRLSRQAGDIRRSSFGSELPHFVARACTIIDVVSRVLAENPFDFSGWTRGSLGLSSPMQPDSFNCGIFALLLSRCLHHDVKISRCWSSKDLDEQRDLVVLELIEGRLRTCV